MKVFLVTILLFFFMPFLLNHYLDLRIVLTIVYIILMLCNMRIFFRKLKKSESEYISDWPKEIPTLQIFYIILYYLLINYYSYTLSLFNESKLIYEYIYSNTLKNIAISILAAIILGWYIEYRLYVKNYYLLDQLEWTLKEIWVDSLYYEYKIIKNYMKIDIEDIEQVFANLNNYKKFNLVDEDVTNIKERALEIEKIMPNINLNMHEYLYYLIYYIKRVDVKNSNLTLELTKKIIFILKDIKKIKKDPFSIIFR